MRSSLIGISMAVAPGEAYYFPFGHRTRTIAAQGELMPVETAPAIDKANLPPLASPALAPLRELLEDPAVRKTAQNGKYDLLVLRRAGVPLRGLDFDTMLRELRARSRPSLARARHAGTRISRAAHHVVRGTERQGAGRDSPSIWCRSRPRGNTPARMPTSRSSSVRNSSRSSSRWASGNCCARSRSP